MSTIKGIGKPELDGEGRVLVTVRRVDRGSFSSTPFNLLCKNHQEHSDFFLVNAYVMNSGDGLKRLEERVETWDPALSSFCKVVEGTEWSSSSASF